MAGARIVFSSGRAAKFAISASFARHSDPIIRSNFRSFSCLGSRSNSVLSQNAVILPTIPYCPHRNYCDDRHVTPQLPRLMEYPQLLWPSIFKVARNWIMAKFVITPYFDRDFSLNEFVAGSQMAIQQVSHCLSRNDLSGLEGLVTPEAITEIKSSLSRFSVQQLSDLAVKKEDIYFSFPYEVGVMFDEEDESQRRYVEITMVYFLLKGLAEYQQRTGQNPDFGTMKQPEYQEKLYVLNYRYIREFTKGVPPVWTVNLLNHYKGRPQ